MDTSSKSKTRTKSMDQKSVNGDEKEESQAAEKQEVSTSDVAADATSSSSSVKESETQERPVPSRKRKASEMKADDEVKTEPKDEEIKTEVEDEQSVSEGVSVSAKQTLGKGKRARIPNKRYSDISITGTPKSESKRHIENGETLGKENTDGAENTSSPMIKAKDSPAPPKKQKITSTDLSNPNYLKPFEHGWKRELVYRATSDNSLKRNGDIYYYTPTGKKVRSMREVAENLKNKELTLDDFTFFKEPLGLDDPEKEIIRDAKLKSSLGGGQSAKKLSTPKTPRTPKSNSPKPTTPAVTTPVARADSPPKTKTKSGSFKVKLPPSKGEKQGRGRSAKKIKEEPQEDMEVGMYPPNWSSPAKKTPGTKYNIGEDNSKPCRPCSIRCPNVLGPIPTLQCLQCLCLYHHECVGLSPQTTMQGYVCKNCHLELDQRSGLGASTEAGASSSCSVTETPNSPSSQFLPKLQRKPDAKSSAKDASKAMPKLTPMPGILSSSTTSEGGTGVESKGLVGSVTTWFPPSSTIQLGSADSSLNTSQLNLLQRPQFVEIVGGKKYLVVPAQNVVAVSPTTPAINKPIAAVEASSEPADMPEGSMETLPNPTPPPLIPSLPQAAASEVTAPDDEHSQPQTKENESPEKKRSTRLSAVNKKNEAVVAPQVEDNNFMKSYMQNLSFGYSAMLYVFQYLKVQDLLRAGCVCTMWRDLASHPSLWRTVRMKNSQVHSFEGLAKALKKHGTVHLDLRKMLLPSSGDDIWPLFSKAIKEVDSLQKIELCRCPAAVVEQLAESNPKLQVLNAVTIKCESMSLDPLKNLTNLQELRLKSTTGLTLSSDVTALKELQQLTHLSLTSIKDLNKLDLKVIAELTSLESLDLGECTDFPKNFGSEILSKLDKLEKLRLEKGQGTCYTFEMLDAVKNMKNLEQLELVNFDIKSGFDAALGGCSNIKKLLIIPTYISQSATTNHMVLGGVLRLQNTLSHFVWGVTLELLRVTELFVDQCEDPEKKEKKDKKPMGTGDSIPVLKPVPLLGENTEIAKSTQDPPQVEILPLPNLQKLLLQNLPKTRVKILKIPFHATWRQTITDTVN